jgi:hypothetical protein
VCAGSLVSWRCPQLTAGRVHCRLPVTAATCWLFRCSSHQLGVVVGLLLIPLHISRLDGFAAVWSPNQHLGDNWLTRFGLSAPHQWVQRGFVWMRGWVSGVCSYVRVSQLSGLQPQLLPAPAYGWRTRYPQRSQSSLGGVLGTPSELMQNGLHPCLHAGRLSVFGLCQCTFLAAQSRQRVGCLQTVGLLQCHAYYRTRS